MRYINTLTYLPTYLLTLFTTCIARPIETAAHSQTHSPRRLSMKKMRSDHSSLLQLYWFRLARQTDKINCFRASRKPGSIWSHSSRHRRVACTTPLLTVPNVTTHLSRGQSTTFIFTVIGNYLRIFC